ncbi:MAG TPA: DHH family phosphoesterase [Tepidisphaeraceae bacterium]|jgi:nanoRNase/pAp phosphatase (c-di-AMP/oligoRNAs hydrolase)
MTSFVESCAKTVTGSAAAAARSSRGRPRARQLLRLLADKKNILITTHDHPDPDAMASCLALCTLITKAIPSATVKVALKGRVGGGLNEIFAKLINLDAIPWDESTLTSYDALVLVDTQPAFGNSPLPASVSPTVVIDHHRSRGRKPRCTFCDVRSDVGATGTIIFSYFMELEQPISPDLAATMLYAIESDLAGAAGQPGELDNIALSSLTLLADTRKLYKMRYVDLPQSVYMAFANGVNNAMYYDNAVMSHLETIISHEQPAYVCDFLVRFDPVQYALVTAIYEGKLVLSLRVTPAGANRITAAELMKRLVKGLGEGGGHRTKAGGMIPLSTGSPTEIERIRATIRRRYIRAVGAHLSRGQRLVPKPGG